MEENSNDYDLSQPITSTYGLKQGLAGYGDPHFSLFLRKVFIKALGYGEDALSRPIIGIINTHSGFNPCTSSQLTYETSVQHLARIDWAHCKLAPQAECPRSIWHVLRSLKCLQDGYTVH
jgi:hypothetical protein